MELEALRMAYDEIKKGEDSNLHREVATKIGGRLGPQFELDQDWTDVIDRRADQRKEKLENELTAYRTNLIKESIRMGYNDFGDFYYDHGHLGDAFKNYVRTRDYCTTSKHIIQMCLNVILVSIELGQFMHVSNYVGKAEQTPDSLDPVTVSKLRCASGLAHLEGNKYKLAARQFLETGNELGNNYTEVIAPQDVATYGGLCALASFDRTELKNKVIDNSNFRNFLELVPEVRELVNNFYASRYASCLEYLEKLKPNLLLDIHLHDHVETLYNQIRHKAIIQYTHPFISVDLNTMADAFKTTVSGLEKELEALIMDGQIQARIDSHNKILYARHADQRNATFQRVLQTGMEFGHFRSFCKSGEREVPWMEIRPHKHWEVPPHDAEVVMKVKLWPPVKGNISGVICLKLQNSAHDNFKTIMLPLEAKVDGKANYNSPTGAISLFFEPLVPCDGKGFVCTLSVRNSASHLLTIVSIAENFNVFEVRYLEGLLLYPDTITHVALISYSHPDVSEHIPTKFPWSSPGCKLYLLTNETSSSKIEIPCEALVQTCCKHGVESGFIPHESSFLGMKAQKDKLMNARTGSLGSLLEESFPLESKFLGLLEADRRILENWRSQGTMAKLSVLKDHELLFPVVQIGTQYFKWITVHNPSQKPVVMQLVLNSGAIIDHCKYPDDSFKPSFKLISIESPDGFSMPETTTTEVILHPLGSAQIGPILFRPSKRCTWRSSALIRNNLSGVEWLPLQAFGGSHSLLLLEGSEAVNKIEFNLNLQSALNASSSGLSHHMESRKKSCIHQLYKELYAKNAGELPVKVTRLEVSGIECGSDGFIIHNCKGFSLAPGESARLLISYQAYFYAAPLKRHLKLTTDTGFLVIPLEASHPVNLTDQCKKSLFWALIWKLPALIFTIVVIVCLLFFIRHAVASARKDYSIKSENTIAISMAEKSHVHRNARNSRPIKKNDKLEEGLAIDRYSHCENSALENTQKVKDRKDSEYQKKPALQSPPPTKIHIGTLDSSGETELPQSGNLTVKVVKERGRRRKRRTGGGLASKLEVSSSQSGNSTPSSPLSPDSFTPNFSFSSFGALVEEHSHEKKHAFSLAIKQTAPEPQRSIGRPVLLPSATFPGTSCRASGITTKLLASSSPLAPHARAPGSKLNNEKGRKTEEDEAYGKQYTYDIWGNHLCAHLMGKSKEITSKVFDSSESVSQSFFTRDPQSLMMMSSAHSETPGHNLTPFDVDYLHQIK